MNIRTALSGVMLLGMATLAGAADIPETVSGGSALVEVYGDDRFFEGPTWDPKTGKLYFTAFGKDNTQILRLDGPGKVTVWADRTEGVNGTRLSLDGRLLGAQAYGHRVMSYAFGPDGPSDTKVVYFDPKLHQPNDVCQTYNGDIYFSDPDFKSKKTSAVYRLRDGKATKVVTDMPLPNGVIASNDGRTLYVGDSDRKHWRSYPIRSDGTVGPGKLFFDPGVENRNDPDGMTIDELGNLYLSGRGGVWVVSPAGKALGLIEVPEFCSNVGFGGPEGTTLYLTCSKKVYSLSMRVKGGRPKAPTNTGRVEVRGVYGGSPTILLERGRTYADFGLNAVWIGSGGLSKDVIALNKKQGAKVFAEFNTMHEASYLKDHPDAAPVGVDGLPCPPPDGWQGVCPTHPGYRANRMAAYRKALTDFDIDGIWLDYHHAHASWEQAEPNMPETCFCKRCLAEFAKATGVALGDKPTPEISKELLGPLHAKWVAWRCGVFTDWVREFDAIRDEVKPEALLGTFHCPWSETDRGGAIRKTLAIDLKAQSEYVDVFSIMPYHARFGHAKDPAWISRQTKALGELLGVKGEPGERIRIWPIVQLSEWGEKVPLGQVREVLEHGTKAPATGVTLFVWGAIAPEWPKVEEIGAFYRRISGLQPAPAAPSSSKRAP